MLATLFDVPQEDRLKLIHWSDTVERISDPNFLKPLKRDFKKYGNVLNTLIQSGDRKANDQEEDLISMP